jgi:hypothetical protein
VWILLFLIESSVIRLSVYMVAVLSSVCRFSVYSSALSIPSCSAWLLVHLLFNLYIRLLFYLNMTMPAPTPCTDLLPSVNIWIVLVSLFSVWKVIISAGWCQYLTSLSRSTSASSFVLPLVRWYNWNAFIFTSMGSILSVCRGLRSTLYGMPWQFEYL